MRTPIGIGYAQGWAASPSQNEIGRGNAMEAAMIGVIRCMLAVAAVLLTPSTFAFAAEQVDLLLALSSDVSRSVDHPKFLLQREGYAAAVAGRHVVDDDQEAPQTRLAK